MIPRFHTQLQGEMIYIYILYISYINNYIVSFSEVNLFKSVSVFCGGTWADQECSSGLPLNDWLRMWFLSCSISSGFCCWICWANCWPLSEGKKQTEEENQVFKQGTKTNSQYKMCQLLHLRFNITDSCVFTNWQRCRICYFASDSHVVPSTNA